ncbi:SET domain-containing protein SmydA-8-like [Macrosteles quadrilineatus]|uniref:SET domain-containing protein SmydA-8-like n=1 Tax=Macrosteles quadrilineatus TaxID=74068 RepID=UPI0023E2007B|nr:SET domain-containing protein SmydA-8-like [Macrosteles quadrilineatus]
MCGRTEATLRAYLSRTLGVDEDSWTIQPSNIGGRGVFATRDLKPGNLVFHDRPVVWGPRAKPDEPMCSSCGRRGRVAACPAGCPLPVCSPICAASPLHIEECRLASSNIDLPTGCWRLDLVGIVTPLRCLFLTPEDREVVQCLQGNTGKIHGVEVDLMKHHMKGKLKREDEEWMRQCCCVMDTNSFEFLRVFEDGAQTSLRGLYPLASIMNNECSPNTCHVYDANGIMKVVAARAITKGEEVTTSYSVLLWSTNIRRINLAKTKHFLCRCSRCLDPTEFGSMLSCLPCTDVQCRGLLLPGNPLKPNSPWFCGSCSMEVSAKQAAQLQAAQGGLVQTLSLSEPPSVAQFLTDSSLPPQSQVIVQLKLGLVWQLGHKPTFTWPELSEDLLDLKVRCCRDILHLLELLNLGECRTKGLILMELHAALSEKYRRLKNCNQQCQDIKDEAKSVLNAAIFILGHDAAAQKDLKIRLEEMSQMA